MMVFIQVLCGKFFNWFGSDWFDVDVIVVEMGMLIMDGYNDVFVFVYISFIDGVQVCGECFQVQDWFIIFFIDEGYLILMNELFGFKVVKGMKMWCKFNIWFWLVMQNMMDFFDFMSWVLFMCEWWMLFMMDKSEIEQVVCFWLFMFEQCQFIEFVMKELFKYIEGVLIFVIGQWFFWNVLLVLLIVLVMIEGYEKVVCCCMMEKYGCSEVDVVKFIVRQLVGRCE